MVMALENCTCGKEWNTASEGFQGIPPGSELLAERPNGHDDVQIRRSLADNVRRMKVGTTVAFHTRPWDPEKKNGKKRIPIEDPFVKLLFKDERVVDVKKLARTAPRGPFDVLGFFDRMLLTLLGRAAFGHGRGVGAKARGKRARQRSWSSRGIFSEVWTPVPCP